MKKIGVCIISFFLFFQNILLAYRTDPKQFVNELVNEAINKLADKNLNKDQKTNFIEKVALENVDIDALGLYTLGELRKSSKEEDISKNLMTSDLPDPDFVIRTSGEKRLSNFLLWQIAYSELYFTKTLWPDFSTQKYISALKNYISRKRRFGGD